MVRLNELYMLAGKVVVIHDVVFDPQNGNFIFYKEEHGPGGLLLCENEKTFLSIATPYTYEIPSQDDT